MRDDLLGAAAIAAHIGKCGPSLIPDLLADGWPIIQVGREYRSTKSAIDLRLYRRQPEKPNARFVIQLEEIRDQVERMLREAAGAQPDGKEARKS